MTIVRFLLPALLGALVTFASLRALDDDAQLAAQINEQENRILELELALAQQADELSRARAFARFEQQFPDAPAGLSQPVMPANNASGQAAPGAAETLANEAVDNLSVDQKVRELSTSSDRDPRSFSQKVNDLLATEAGKNSVAIASKGIFDLADNPASLPDQELEAVYYNQTDPELKRVAAQVLSMRGDNTLLDKQVNDAQSGLRSEDPAQRQKTLVDLAKTRYAGAANVIAPLLQDQDTGVKLDALLALRSTGNQSHVHLVEGLVNHPDPAVSWLAKDVIDNLQNLSEKARTRIVSNDIGAELPVYGVQ